MQAPYVTRKVKRVIDEIFPDIMRGEVSERAIARQFGVSQQTIRQYRRGKYWQWKEEQWQIEQEKLRKVEELEEEIHLSEHGNSYRLELQEMQKELSRLTFMHIEIANHLAEISSSALDAITKESEGKSAMEICHEIHRKGIPKIALAATQVAKEARENFSQAYGLQELLEHLEEVVMRVGA